MIFKKILLLSALSTFLVACDSSPVQVTGSGTAVTGDTGGATNPDTNTEAEGGTSTDTQGGAATESAVCVDTRPIGDGWGWNGTESCRIGADADSNTGNDSASVGSGDSCVDTPPFGNGWGWNGTESCRIGSADNDAGTGTGTADTGRINLLGLLKLEPNSSETDFSRALFGRFQNPLTAQEIQNWYAPTTDTCQVTPVNANDSNEPQLNVFEQRLGLINAGETVVLSSNAGTYATLNRVQGSAGPIYRTEVALNVEPPGGLTVDVTGADFPAFSDVPVGDVPALRISNPAAGQNVDGFNFFQWNANNVSLSVVEIYTGGIAANGQEVIVGCTVVDDGNFSFPQSVRAQLGTNFDDDWTAYLRVVYNVARNGDALLVTANSVLGTR